MNMLKRIASVAVALVMMLQIAVFAAPVPEDVIGTEYESAASLLCALNIMVGDGTNFNPDDNITRAEFAQIMMKSMALDSAAESYQPKGLFEDVPTDNIFAPAIELGAGIGAIKGYGDGKFGPDDNVLGTEAVKMMTFAAGHDVIAENNGGYPAGYMARAREIGMLKGITGIDFSVPMTRGQAAVLCANTLKVDMMKKVTVGGKITYELKDDVNLLSEKHDVYKVSGLISANSATSLWQTSTLSEGKVQIEDGVTSRVLLAGETTIADAIGKTVDAYYIVDEDADTQIVVSYDISDNKNTIVTVDLADVEYDTVTNTKVEYWADRENDVDTTELDIVSAPSIILNGTARIAGKTVADTFAEIDGKPGQVAFIDNNGDGNVDILNIVAYDTIYVNKINTNDYKISDKLSGKTWTIDVYASNMTASIVDIDNEPMEFEDISEGDVLSIAMSDSGLATQSVTIIDSQESVDGEVTAISVKDDQYVISIDDEKYELSKEYFNYITNNLGLAMPASDLKIKIGSVGEFFLDAFNQIVYDEMEGISGDAAFGMLRAAAPGKGADTSLKLKIYADGEYLEYTAAGKVNIDGTVHKGEAAIAAGLQTSLDYVTGKVSYYSTIPNMVPLLFAVDADDKINMIDTVYRGAEESEYSLQQVKNTDWETPKNYTYNKNLNSLGSMLRLESSAFVIQLPVNASEVDNVNKITISKASSWANEKTVSNVQAFTTEPDSNKMMYGVSQLTSTAANLGDTSSEVHDKQLLVVSEVLECLNDEGERTITIKGLQEAAEKEFTVDADYYSTDLYGDIWDTDGIFSAYADQMVETTARKENILLPGDAIRYRLNDMGEAIYIRPTYLIDAKVFRTDDQGGTQAATRYRAFDMAVVQELDGNDMYMKYIIDKKTGSYTSATAMVNVNSDGFVVSSTNTKNENLSLYDEASKTYGPDMVADEFNTASAFKIMVYDASKPAGQKVYAGSTFDLYDASDNGTPASLIIMQFRSSNPRGMYIIKY